MLSRRIDNAMVKAIARAFRWREMLENGTHEFAAAEKINETYVGRVPRLPDRTANDFPLSTSAPPQESASINEPQQIPLIQILSNRLLIP